jgi:uncharacterized membrane protein
VQLWLILLVVLLVLFAVATASIVLRRRPPAPPDLSARSEAIEEVRRERQRAAEALGTELLDRRVQLDARRGPLAGYSQIDEEFRALEQRLQAGEITEEEFEREKSRLLGG